MKYWTSKSGALGVAMMAAAVVLAAADDPPISASPSSAQVVAPTPSEDDLEVRFARIQQRGAKVSAKKRADAEQKIAAAIQTVGAREATDGAQKIAGRIAAELRTTPEKVMADQAATGASFGELALAYTLQLNTEHDGTAAQLIELHQRGTGWAQIGAGLGFKLGEVVSAARAETRVAAGVSAPDGRVAPLVGGPRVGVGPVLGASRDGMGDPATPQIEAGANHPIPAGKPTSP